DEHVTLVALARFVEIGADERALVIDDPLDAACQRTAVHMTVEHAHEDGNAGERPIAERQFLRRHGFNYATDCAVGGRDQKAVSLRRHPLRIAEEIGAPQRRDHRQPAERRPQPQENESYERESADERIALRMDRRELRTDRVDDGHDNREYSGIGENLSLSLVGGDIAISPKEGHCEGYRYSSGTSPEFLTDTIK